MEEKDMTTTGGLTEEMRHEKLAELVESGIAEHACEAYFFTLIGERQVSRDLARSVGQLCGLDADFCEMALAHADELFSRLLILRPGITAYAYFDWNNWDENSEPRLVVNARASEAEMFDIEFRQDGYVCGIEQQDSTDCDPREWSYLVIDDVERWLEINAAREAFFQSLSEKPKSGFIPYPAPPNPHPEKPER